MTDETGARIDRMEARFESRFSKLEDNDRQILDELAELRGERKVRNRLLAGLVGAITTASGALLAWLLGLFK